METLRYPTLQAWADGICNAVRAKDGTADPIDHQDVPDRILAIQTGNNIDLSGITAQQSDVSERVQYIDATGELKYGTMPEITAETKTLDGDNTECAIEEGHHDGGGKVRIVPETLYAAPSRSTQELESPAGKVYTKVILDPIPDIYKDVSAADAVPGAVLNGYTFYGKAGELETGNIVTKNGKQGATVSANGNRYIPVGYHDGTTYITVNVPQEIVTVEGEDSSNTTAVAADIREGETARSKGKLVTGTMPDVTMGVSIGDIDEDSLLYYAQVKATATVSTGYITGGKVSTTKLIPKFTDSNAITPDTKIVTVATKGKYLDKDIYVSSMPKYSGSYTVTPGDSAQTLYTANKYLSENIVVEPADNTGSLLVLLKNVDCSSTYTDQLSISGLPSDMSKVHAVIISRQSLESLGNRKIIQDVYWEDTNYDGTANIFSYSYFTGDGTVSEENGYIKDVQGFRSLDESYLMYSRNGTTIQIDSTNGWFYGVYRVVVLGVR